MKWFALIFCTVIAVVFSACEKHDVSELKQIDESAEHGGTAAEHAKAPEKK
jgi:hypothetical protein